MIFSDDSIIATRHGALVPTLCDLNGARVLIENIHQGLIGMMIEMMDEVPSRQEISDSLWGWLVCDRGRDDIGHVSMILLDRNIELRIRIESAKGGQVNVTTKDRDSNVVRFSK